MVERDRGRLSACCGEPSETKEQRDVRLQAMSSRGGDEENDIKLYLVLAAPCTCISFPQKQYKRQTLYRGGRSSVWSQHLGDEEFKGTIQNS